MVRLSQLPKALALSLVAATAPASAVPSIDVSMRAAFPEPPYLLELIETAAGENATSYFPLLDRVASGHFDAISTDKDLYETFLQVLADDGHVLEPEALSTFKLALSMRAAAPRIEAHYQYYSTGVEPKLKGASQDGCEAWVLFKDRQHCEAGLQEPRGDPLGYGQVKPLPFDRILGSGPPVVLYADITSPSFRAFHGSLAERAKKGQVSYMLRHRRATSSSGNGSGSEFAQNLPVSGYGVELALKKTDYIVIDDRDATDPTQRQDAASRAEAGSQVLLGAEEEVSDLKPLSKADLLSLGLKTCSFIMKSENPFETLVQLSQDFPKHSNQMVSQEASPDFIEEHEAKLEMVPSGLNVLWMNGVQLIERQIEPFTLVDMLRRERKFIDGVRKLGLTGKQAVALLSHSNVTQAKVDDEPLRFDWRDDLEGGKVIVWLNNIETDERYQDFPANLGSLLQRTYPGQIPSIRRDIFNLIVPLDFANLEDVKVAMQLEVFINRMLPIRFGLVPLNVSPESVDVAKILYSLYTAFGSEAVMSYIQLALKGGSASADKGIFTKVVEISNSQGEAQSSMTFERVLASEDLDERMKLAIHWADRLKANTRVPPVFINGFAIPREDGWLQAMSMRLSTDLQLVQQGVYLGTIVDEMWIPSVFLEKAVSKRNIYVYPEDEKALSMLDVSKLYMDNEHFLAAVPVIDAYAESTKENWAALTLVADVTSEQGLDILLSALQFRRENPGIRLEIIHNPAAAEQCSSSVSAALLRNLDKLIEVDTAHDITSLLAAGEQDECVEALDRGLQAFLETIKVARGSHLLILNGRVIGPIAEQDGFNPDDFEQLLHTEQAQRILPVYAAVDDLGLGKTLSGPLAAAKLTSITALSTMSDLPEGIFEAAPTLRTSAFEGWPSKHSAIEMGEAETASIHLVGLLNPVSEQGQRWAPIIKVLSELEGVYVKLFLNPRERIEELPVKRFYRYVLDSEPTFDESGKVKGRGAHFSRVPSEALLTLGMNVPPAWLVAPKVSVHDLDNIKLSSVKGNVEAVYELQHILIEGHSRTMDDKKAAPPSGAQLVLGTEKDPHAADTIIMANLGFFQFKANPGFYHIQLQEGRSADIFEIESVGAQGYNPVAGDEGTEVALMDFQGTTLYPRFKRKPGMETADVLESGDANEAGPEAQNAGFLAKGRRFAEGLFGVRGGSKSAQSQSQSATRDVASGRQQADINIFSVASGHLYERMLNIMMVSVMRHTNHTVKFWFIEQFLSPSFKDFIPHLAREYGFDYEMVTYKWPHWLRQQKEKQREIWGYKILFLDVLFPLSLDKVIFVDADQIVRTDMMELVQTDLDGAPYGFAPMCDSRTEMEGFRFWKQGYWANYLRGLPYHISALYVVDLRRFRALAAGDRLRQQYHSLSADPNSLANLDQDLPNHMQFVIPIHSLDQDWLWCETWCSDESLATARTIDLCNNPMTKEPKLARARRQVPEWSVYDAEIAALDRRRKGEGSARGGNNNAEDISVQEAEQVRELMEEKEREKKVQEEEQDRASRNTKSRNWEEPVDSERRERDEL